jgi:hypothetical protein
MATTTTPEGTGQSVRATLEQLSVCSCGFPILNEEIPRGTEYFLDTTQKLDMHIICGGCGKMQPIRCVFVHPRTEDGYPGFLPESIFEVMQPSLPGLKYVPCPDAPPRVQRAINAINHWAAKRDILQDRWDCNRLWMQGATVQDMREHRMPWVEINRLSIINAWLRKIHKILAREEGVAYRGEAELVS